MSVHPPATSRALEPFVSLGSHHQREYEKVATEYSDSISSFIIRMLLVGSLNVCRSNIQVFAQQLPESKQIANTKPRTPPLHTPPQRGVIVVASNGCLGMTVD